MFDGLMLSESARDALETATATYEKNVNTAASYLAGRGVTERAALGFRLGCVDEPAPGHERFRGWLSIPYLTPAGPVAMKFRRLDGSDGPKYDAPAGQKIRLYNAQACADGGPVGVIVEGEFDAIIGTTVVGVPTVGTWGTNWLDHYPRCFGNFDRVLVVADNDPEKPIGPEKKMVSPGLRQARKIQQSIHGAELITPPLGFDLSEWVEHDGVLAVRKAMGL